MEYFSIEITVGKSEFEYAKNSYPLLISTDFLKYPFRQLFQTGIKFQL